MSKKSSQLLLLNDVESLGRQGQIVHVTPGYARNFLFPQRLGMIADARALRMQAKLVEERKKRAEIDRKESEEKAKQIEGLILSTVVKVDHEGHLYGSVTALDVAKLLLEQHSIAVEKREIALKAPVKKLGLYPVVIRLKEDVQAQVTLKVMNEQGETAVHVAASPVSEEKKEKKAAKKTSEENVEEVTVEGETKKKGVGKKAAKQHDADSQVSS